MSRISILISGAGSNMVALARAIADTSHEVSLVLCNVPGAAGLDRARELGLPTALIDHRPHPDRESFERAVEVELARTGTDIVALAGFMRILTPGFAGRWQGRVLNIHPSLLPAYRGRDTHARVLAAGERETGCTVHLVTPELDAGPVLGQERVPVEPGDTAQTLAARVQAAEHRLYPRALLAFADRVAAGASA